MNFGREIFSNEKVKTYEEKLTKDANKPMTIRDLPWAELLSRCETAHVDDEIMETKVLDTVIRGAQDDASVLNMIARVVQMDSEIEVIPLISPDSFKWSVAAGKGKVESMGGRVDRVKLDCSVDRGLYKGALDLPSTIRNLKSTARKAGLIEEMLWAAGNAAMKSVVTTVAADLIADVDSTMTNSVANWGNDHYKALVKADALISKQTGLAGADFILINPDEKYDIGILDYFIKQEYQQAGRGIPPADPTVVGSLYGRIPIISHRGCTAATMVIGIKSMAEVVGIYQDFKVEEYSDVREGLQGSILSMQYDYKNGSNAELDKPTLYSWATVTSA